MKIIIKFMETQKNIQKNIFFEKILTFGWDLNPLKNILLISGLNILQNHTNLTNRMYSIFSVYNFIKNIHSIIFKSIFQFKEIFH